MLDKLKAYAKVRWVILGATVVYVALGILLGHLDPQQAISILLQTVGL